jgi:hypothetical protein
MFTTPNSRINISHNVTLVELEIVVALLLNSGTLDREFTKALVERELREELEYRGAGYLEHWTDSIVRSSELAFAETHDETLVVALRKQAVKIVFRVFPEFRETR